MQARVEITANSILKLLVHYYQDSIERVPLDAELTSAGVSPYMSRWIMLEATSDKWDNIRMLPGWNEPYPLHVRYEGGKTMSWGGEGETNTWRDAVEAPK